MKEMIIATLLFGAAFIWGFITGSHYTKIRSLSTVNAIQKCEEKLPRNQHCVAKIVTQVIK